MVVLKHNALKSSDPAPIKILDRYLVAWLMVKGANYLGTEWERDNCSFLFEASELTKQLRAEYVSDGFVQAYQNAMEATWDIIHQHRRAVEQRGGSR